VRQRARTVIVTWLLSVVLAPSCATERGASRPPTIRSTTARAATHAPPRPARCTTVPAGGALQPYVDRAQEGAALCLASGRHWGPVRITRRLSVWGPRAAEIRTRGTGTTVLIEGRGTRLAGVTVNGSGGRYDTDDAAVKVHADDVVVEGVRIVNAVFGVLAERANRALIRDNDVSGHPEVPTGLRGDGIRLWEMRDSRVENNRVRWGRDCVLWYSSGNVFAGNTIEHGRYGAHLMYSHDNRIEHNRFVADVVGTFLMYSRHVVLSDNDYVDISSPAGMGVGLKECENVDLRRNRFVHCTIGLYVDTSPLSVGGTDHVVGNEWVLSEHAVVFHGRAEGNLFEDNAFRASGVVECEGGGSAVDSRWRHNYFDGYQGYDLDGDGFGDVAHEERSLADQLTSTRPVLQYFRGTPALAVVDALGRLVPLFAPKTLVRDEQPRVSNPVEGSPS